MAQTRIGSIFLYNYQAFLTNFVSSDAGVFSLAATTFFLMII